MKERLQLYLGTWDVEFLFVYLYFIDLTSQTNQDGISFKQWAKTNEGVEEGWVTQRINSESTFNSSNASNNQYVPVQMNNQVNFLPQTIQKIHKDPY